MLTNTLQLINIDRRSTLDYDLQLKDNIKALILDQTFYYKTKLPKVFELAEYLDIDDNYVIKAYQKLINENFIKEKDSVYSVSYIELTNYFFERNTSIYDAVISLGLTPSIKCLEKKVVKLAGKTQIEMGFDGDESSEFLYINRMYYGDNQPIIILENYLPLSIFKDMEKNFKGHEPLNNYIGENYGFKAHVSKRITKAVTLDKGLAHLLHERVNASSLQSTNKVYDSLGRMIDYGQSHSISSYYFQALINKREN